MAAATPVPTRTLVPARAEHAAPTAAPIVAAVDSSAASRTAVEEAAATAAELGATLVFVYVRRGPADYLGAPIREGSPRRRIVEFARDSGAQLIVVSSRRRRLGRRVARAVARAPTARSLSRHGDRPGSR